MGDSTGFKGKGKGPVEDETPASPAIDHGKPRGMWEHFNRGSPEKASTKPRGAWELVNELANQKAPDARNVGQSGIQGSGSALPYADKIQKSFGRHDVSGIAAHEGGSAEKATNALGAKAYAQGEHVAFGSEANSLHTVAHEAAHVVQQRRGAAPGGAIDGGTTDPHEQHANAVADRVVQGESAEPLLDTVGRDGASPVTPSVQRVPKTKLAKPEAKPEAKPGARDLDAGIASGQRAVQMVAIAHAMFPAYRRAVNALDPLAALELAHNLIGALNQAEEGKREVIETLGDDPPQHWMVSTPGRPELTEDAVKTKWAQLGGIKLRLMGELMTFEMELATQIGPQQLDGAPVMGAVTLPKLAADALPYLISEAGVVVELLGVVNEAMRIAGAKLGTCPQIAPAKAQEIIKLVAPWKSRPVNFGFIVAALRKVGIWDEINSIKSEQGKTLTETNTAVAAQAKETGALADVGELDTETMNDMLGDRTEVVGDVVRNNRVTDAKAQRLLERLIGAAADARGPLIKQIQKMGKLDEVCKHLPFKTVQAIHDAVEPFDKDAAKLLVPYFADKGGGTSVHKMYEDNIMEDIHDEKYVRAYLWTFLDTAHNALTGGFEHEYSEAYDAREAGLITDDAFHSAAGKALGKAAAIMVVSAATGGVAGEFGEGLATGLGASRSAASIIGAGVGGFGAGVGGHFAGDVYDQALNGKKGFDSFGSYMMSGAEGGIMGTVMGGISVGAGKYLGESGAAPRPIDEMAERYPSSAKVLERIRGAGFKAGNKFQAGAAATATKIKVTAAELADMIASGLAIPTPQLAGVGGRIPPNTEVEISVRPMQMSSVDKPKPGAATPTAKPHETPKLEIEEIKVEPEVSVMKMETPVEELEVTTSSVSEPRSGAPNPEELEHFEKGEFNENDKLTGGGHAHDNMAELNKRGFEDLAPEEVARLRKEQQPYEDARKTYEDKERAVQRWDKEQKDFGRKLVSGKELGKLKNPGLPQETRLKLEKVQAERNAALEKWKQEHPRPSNAGKRPKPQDFGLNPADLLSTRKIYYHEALGKTGAETGGVSSTNPIHGDGHTWFPPGWQAEPIMELLESSAPGISSAPLPKGGGTRRTAWIKRDPNGKYEVAPSNLPNPAEAGYLKSSLITPSDGAGRTVFPEMNQ